MSWLDIFAVAAFILAWLGYSPAVSALHRNPLNRNMEFVREAWMRRMLGREVRITDTNILSQLLGSASFFASTNLLIIAAATGAILAGESSLSRISDLTSLSPAPTWLVEVKIGLVVLTLSVGLLDFIWAIRQLNYALALVGAAPDFDKLRDDSEAYVRAAVGVLNRAAHSFNAGVRGYYFSLAAAAWLISPWAMTIAAAGAVGILWHRQIASRSAAAIRAAHAYLLDYDRHR